MTQTPSEWEERFKNIFIYHAYGIVEGEGKAMQIRRQEEYQPLTYENVKAFIAAERHLAAEETVEKCIGGCQNLNMLL